MRDVAIRLFGHVRVLSLFAMIWKGCGIGYVGVRYMSGNLKISPGQCLHSVLKTHCIAWEFSLFR
jgi:hypothetical protein